MSSDEFPILDELVYLNHAGVSPLPRRTALVMAALAEQASRRASHAPDWYSHIRRCKTAAARLLNARGPHEMAMIPNTTTGIAQVARGLDWRPGDNVITTSIEYPANRYPWEDLQRLGVQFITVAPTPGADGRIDVEEITEKINDRTRVVAVSHVQFSNGFRMDLRGIADVLKQLPGRRGWLFVDGIQSLGALPVDVRELGIDCLAADGHKWLLGPEGAGVFYCREDLIPMLHPLVIGWGSMVDPRKFDQYRFELRHDGSRFEPGTMNMLGLAALATSIELLLEVGLDEVWRRIERLTARLGAGLAERGYRVASPRRQETERSGIVSFSPPQGVAPVEEIAAALERRGIVLAVRAGRLRASPHFYNTAEQMDQLLDALPLR